MDSTVPIYSRVNESGTVFISLERALRNSSRFAAQVRPEDIKDEFDRFKIWAGNIAAHRKGRRSLEYRLRDAALLKDEAHNLLKALHDSLQTCLAIVQEKRRPWDELSDSESDSDSDTELSDAAETQSDTELNIITVDKSYFEEYDMQHVKAKYPSCADYLVKRLGRANSGRRQYLSYREEHHQKLAKDVDLIGLEAPRTEHTSNSTEATSMPEARVNGFEVLDSDDALSQTSYATSVNTAIRVPPLPKEAHEKDYYECPICFMIVSIHTAVGWKQHVYQDVHSYCCTFEDCTTADRLYDSRRAWFTHELEAHRTSWQCIEGCEKMFSLEKDFDGHVQTSHPDLGQPGMLSALKRTATKRASLSDEAYCPLCDQRMTLRLLQRHVARHQEQLALFALPPNLEATEDDRQDEEREAYERGWQDEELSDVSDTLDANESAFEEQVPVGGSSPEALQIPVQERDAITLKIRNDINRLHEEMENNMSEQLAIRDHLGNLQMIMLSSEAFSKTLPEIDDRGRFELQRLNELNTKLKLLGKGRDTFLRAEPKEGDKVEEVEEESLRKFEEEAGTTGVEPSPMSNDPTHPLRFSRWNFPDLPELAENAASYEPAFTTNSFKESSLKLYDAHRPPRFDANAESNHVASSSLHSMTADIHNDEDTRPQPKGILRKPTEEFPKDPNPDWEGVAPLGRNEDVPPFPWTKIPRELVSPEALTETGERFEERLDFVFVLRHLSGEEIQKLIDRTKGLRELRVTAKEAETKRKQLSIRRAAQGAGTHRLDEKWKKCCQMRKRKGNRTHHGITVAHLTISTWTTSGRFNKRDTVHMSLIEGGIRSKVSFTLAKSRLHSWGAYYEYSLVDSNGMLHKNGEWIREKDTRMEICSHSNVAVTVRLITGKRCIESEKRKVSWILWAPEGGG
ncbi:hypothetical protein DL770_008796 [Monosporascus sp. CRB-9-2]|nr:hypothetical protein DL770_008796 [Monosporascus sp. CRB-9-2]